MECKDKPEYTEQMQDSDFLLFIHHRLTELGDRAYYRHVARLIELSDKIRHSKTRTYLGDAENGLASLEWDNL